MVDDAVIQVRDQYYILATSSLADSRTRVLKSGDTFAGFDQRREERDAHRILIRA